MTSFVPLVFTIVWGRGSGRDFFDTSGTFRKKWWNLIMLDFIIDTLFYSVLVLFRKPIFFKLLNLVL